MELLREMQNKQSQPSTNPKVQQQSGSGPRSSGSPPAAVTSGASQPWAVTPPNQREQFNMFIRSKQYAQAEELGNKLLQSLERMEGKRTFQWIDVAVTMVPLEVSLKRESEKNHLLHEIISTLDSFPQAIEVYFYANQISSWIETVSPESLHTFMYLLLLDITLLYPHMDELTPQEKQMLLKPDVLKQRMFKIHSAIEVSSSQGCWKKIDETIPPIIEAMKNATKHLYYVYDSYCSALHQQGRTLEAAKKFEDYAKEMEAEEATEETMETIIMSLSRASKFHFYVDDYATAAELLTRVKTICLKSMVPMKFKDQLELSIAYREDGKIDLAEEVLTSTLNSHNFEPTPLLRSKYLLTTDSTIKSSQDGYRYELSLKVCRCVPARKEGQLEESEEQYLRKLQNFFLVASFENFLEGGEPVVVEKEINHYDVSLCSPVIPSTPVSKWYLIRCTLFSDSRKEKEIGSHHQPTYFRSNK
eukprot:TRINITY_DN1957_c0_g2_i2.p1 TRINITY_DN1957_c0_g2~~TRINITY_DN1957_c0_g2_i2.p1  ORF type:complete len:538 (-),score=123.22 TRINITY_DN1957_c0_g2_i2:38-1459(-)